MSREGIEIKEDPNNKNLDIGLNISGRSAPIINELPISNKTHRISDKPMPTA